MSILREVARVLYKTNLSSFFKIKKHGFELRFFPTKISKRLWVDGFEKKGVYDLVDQFYIDHLAENDVVIDAGANIGYYSLLSAKLVGRGGHVYSIEAHPRTYNFLQKNVLLNKFENISTFKTALGDQRGTISFTDQNSDNLNQVSDNLDDGLVVNIIPLDELGVEHDKIKLLKIDVEGYEKFVLNGANNILARTEIVFFEAWNDHFKKYNYSLQDIFKTLDHYGFKYEILTPSGLKAINNDYDPVDCVDIVAQR